MIRKSLFAGLLVGLGCIVYLSTPDKIVGSFLFGFALLCVCYLKCNLYTGKVGTDMIDSKKCIKLPPMILFNMIAVCIVCILASVANPLLSDTAKVVVANKLAKAPHSVFIDSFLCGVVMYIAVTIYKESNSIVGIVFGIPLFILSGFEHCIADLGYFAASLSFDFVMIYFLPVAIAGNTFGSIAAHLLHREVTNERSRTN